MTAPDVERDLEAVTTHLVEVQDQLLALVDLADALRGHLEPEPLLEALVDQAVRLVGATGAFVALPSPQGPPLVVRSPRLPLGDAAVRVLVEPAAGATRAPRQSQSADGRLLLVAIPLHDGPDALLGLLRSSGARFSTPEEKLAAAIAAQAGAQLEACLLHQRRLHETRLNLEFELARRVQAGLAPAAPTQHPGLDLHAVSHPASVVGGDFYDFTAGRHGDLIAYLGDVAGKGIPAALLVGMTRAVTRSATRDRTDTPLATILHCANADLYQDFSRLGLFATMFVARFDPLSRILFMANAGHSPVIYVPSGGGATLLRSQAPPLGVLPEWEGRDTQLRLGVGDLLVVATDGFSEAEDHRTRELFGYDRLLRLAEEVAGQPSAEVAAAFFRVTDDFAAATMDDRTLLVCTGVEVEPGSL